MKIVKNISIGLLATLSLSVYGKTFVLMDIDNTLFKNGEPIPEMIKKARELESNKEIAIYYLTGRKENEVNKKTLNKWFKKQNLDSSKIYLKNDKEIYTNKFKYDFLYNISGYTSQDKAIVIDDNKRNLEEFKDKKIKVILVNKVDYSKTILEINNALK